MGREPGGSSDGSTHRYVATRLLPEAARRADIGVAVLVACGAHGHDLSGRSLGVANLATDLVLDEIDGAGRLVSLAGVAGLRADAEGCQNGQAQHRHRHAPQAV